MNTSFRYKVRSIALTTVAPVAGFLVLFLIQIASDIEFSRLVSSLINLIVVAVIAFVIFPGLLGIPFGRTDARSFLKGVGAYFPQGAWKHILLGIVLAICTLGAMLLASALTGQYVVDLSRIRLEQVIFSLNPALWEELFYRGVIMILLLRFTRSLKQATAIQIVLFGLMHIKGFDGWAFVDVLTVMIIALAFTFSAYQTRTLLAGIVFHFFHDALLFFVQVPSDVQLGTADQLLFFGLLWAGVGVACLVTWLAARKLGVRAPDALYQVDELSAPEAGLQIASA